MNMKLLAVVTPPYIYHGRSTRRTLWEENFTLGEFTAVNTKNFGLHNVRKHRDIKNGDKYITLDISLKFGSLDKVKTTSSEPKDCMRRSGKGLITSLGLKDNLRSKKDKKARYAINNVIMKDISKIIKDLEKLPYKGYVQKRTKHEPTDI